MVATSTPDKDANGKLNLKGNAFTLCARLRDPEGNWMAPLFSKHGGHTNLVYNLFSHDFGQGQVIGFELGTDGTKGMTQVSVPLAMIGEREWHDLVCRYDGAKLQIFVDGVWMDEGFPMGALRQGNREPCLIGAESDERNRQIRLARSDGPRGHLEPGAFGCRRSRP